MKPKCKLCPICLTKDYDLIRNCELRGGRFPECESNRLAHVDPYVLPITAPTTKRERARP